MAPLAPPLWIPACAGMTGVWLGVYDTSACFVFLWVPAFAKGVNGELCFSLGSRLRGNDEGVRGNDGGSSRCHPHPSPLPSRERGCQSACFVFLWVPACAGMEMETRKKPGAVFNPVLLRERSWICASAVERRRQS